MLQWAPTVQALAYVYFSVLRRLGAFGAFSDALRGIAGRRSAAHLLTCDEARRIAANIAKLPDLLRGSERPA